MYNEITKQKIDFGEKKNQAVKMLIKIFVYYLR